MSTLNLPILSSEGSLALYLSEIKKTTKENISEIFVLNKFHSAYLTNSLKL